MILSAQSIRERVHWGQPYPLLIEPFVENGEEVFFRKSLSYGLGPAGYDIRIGQMEREGRLQPGEFRLVSALERIELPPDLLGLIKDKSTLARMGLAVQNTVIEPGWGGFLTLELSNHGPGSIALMPGMPIAQVIFHLLDQPTILPYHGKYQDQGPAPEGPR